MITIPKIMTHIWVGPKPPPKKWMDSWIELHTDWEYTVFTDDTLSEYDFINRESIQYCLDNKVYTAAADIIRYELLYINGGFIPPADSLCMFNTDELFMDGDVDMSYCVYESETIRPNVVCPVYASTPNHPFLKLLLNEISTIPVKNLHVPYISVGNLLVSKHLYKKERTDVKIFPSHYFVPNHFMGKRYSGTGKVYATQMWGSTLGKYHLGT
jgi:mannosyltransferase OCH1-like enzyme